MSDFVNMETKACIACEKQPQAGYFLIFRNARQTIRVCIECYKPGDDLHWWELLKEADLVVRSGK